MESWYPVGNLCNLEGRLGGPLEVKTSNHARCSINLNGYLQPPR